MNQALYQKVDLPLNNSQKLLSVISDSPMDSKLIKQAYKFCFFITKNHYENFPVASIAIPKHLRHHIAAVYAFSRLADDFADEKEFEGHRMTLLNEWESQLKSMTKTKPTHPVFIALKDTVQKFKIPVSLFNDLITAFKMDVMVSRYKSFEQVLNYCRYSANPVGRIVLYIMGFPAPKLLEYSDYICTGLQLANFWQDVSIDLKKDRIYLPQEDLARFEYSENELKKNIFNENFKRLMNFQVLRTTELFNEGKLLASKIPGRFGYELRLTWLGGTTILNKILKNEGDVFNKRPQLTKPDFLKLALKAFNKKNFK